MKKPTPAILKSCNKIFLEHQSWEPVLSFLKNKKYSKVETMMCLVALDKMSINDAKKVVHFSETWKDVRKRDEKFHDDLLKAVEGKRYPL